jgi:hypothetical protein
MIDENIFECYAASNLLLLRERETVRYARDDLHVNASPPPRNSEFFF